MNPRDTQRVAWLRETLGAPAPSVAPASSDASFRRYFRFAHGDQSRIVMDAPPPQEDCHPFVQVTAVLREAGLNVPQIFAADLIQGFLLLSDLGDEVYLDCLNDNNCDVLYHDAIKALVRMQSRGDVSSLPAYCHDKLHDEMQLFVDWFCVRHLQIDCSGEALAVLENAFELLIHEAQVQPQVFVHRDYHSRNLMRTDHENPGILDYQDAVLGPIGYDLVSLLRDVYVRWPESQIDQWLAFYHQLASEENLLDNASIATFTRWFDLLGIQRHLKIAGIFARLNYRDGKARYLDDIDLTLAYLLDVAGRYPEFSPLVALLHEFDVRARSHQRIEQLDTKFSDTNP
ncbi:MAG: aminoglycoside/choline kinase family phosphotransferase [Gammaproteobacteria bacterium]|jgi:aminoglycoside/choline kinase family phosphotransferase